MQHPGEELYRLRQFWTCQVPDRFFAVTAPQPPVGFQYRDRTSIVLCRETLERMQSRKWNFARFPLLDSPVQDVGKINDWRKDQKSGTTSPLVFSNSINLQNYALVGDVKYVSVLSRFHFLPFYAIDAVTNDNSSSMQAMERILMDWTAQNPYLSGIHWKMGIEAGIRALNLVISRKILLLGDPPLGLLKCLDALIYQCLHFLLRHPSLYSSANNHRVVELLGLIAILAHYDHPSHERLLNQAAGSFIDELFLQNYSDGGNREQSIQYHIEALDASLIACCMLQATGYAIPGETVSAQLRKMGEFLEFFLYPDGSYIRTGDDDEGQFLFPYHDPEYRQSWSVLSSLQLYLGSPARSFGPGFDLRQYLMGGEEWYGRARQATEIPVSGVDQPSTLFRESGYGFINLAESRLMMDFGEIGLRPMAAHGHSDVLSFTMDYKGVPFIVDPGTFQYHGRTPFRQYFRSIRAHNTVSVNGLDQALSGGRMIWLKLPEVSHCEHQDDGSTIFFEAEHDGFVRQGAGVIHRRRIEYHRAEKVYVVTDWLVSSRSYRMEFLLHFHPDVVLEKSDLHRVVARSGGLKLELESTQFENAQISRGVEHPPLGWYSDRYDRKQPCCTLIAGDECRGRRQFRTTIALR